MNTNTGNLLFLTLLCSHLMCLDRSPELLNEYKHCGHLLFLTLRCTHLMCLDRSPELLNEYKHCGHLLFPPYYVIAEKNFSAYTHEALPVFIIYLIDTSASSQNRSAQVKKKPDALSKKPGNKPQNIAACSQASERYTVETIKSGVTWHSIAYTA
jgi:hypothetical protein